MTKDSEKGKYASPDGSATWEYIATMSCSLLIFCIGCIPGWNSPTLGILMGPDSPIPLTPSNASTLSIMISLGHILAPVLVGVMINVLGRKNSILASGIPTILSWGLISVTNNIIVLFVARLIGGLSLGLVHCLPQMYLGEIASAKLRGSINMVCGTMMNAGILFMFIMVPNLSVQATALVSLGLVTLAILSIWFIPESPYYLAMVGRFEEAESSLEKLRGKTDVAEELELIKMTINQKRKKTADAIESKDQEASAKSSALKQLFSVAGNRKALLINFLFAGVLFFGSYICVVAYGQIIFEKMNTGISTYVCTMILATLQIVSNVLTILVIDRIGRRPLICISGVISGACLLSVGIYFYLIEYTETDVTPYGIFALCGVFGNVIALNIGLMPLQHVIQSEVLATEIKELAACIIGISGGVMAAAGLKSYLMLAETWNFGHCVPFFGFSAITWSITALLMKLLPETKGKTLWEIQKDLNSS